MTATGNRRPFVWRDGTGRPPLLMLHGTGGDERDLLPLATELNPVSPVLSPRGTVLEGGASRFFRRISAGLFDERDLAEQAENLAGFVVRVGAEHDIGRGQFVAVGFSNGANIASAMMFVRPDVLSGAVLIAAMVPSRELTFDVDLTGKWVVIANGRQDPTIPAQHTASLAQRLRDLGAHIDLVDHGGGHTIDIMHIPEISKIIAGHQG